MRERHVNRRRFFGEKGDERLHPAGFLGVRQVVEIDAGVGFPVVAQYRPEALAVGQARADGREQAANAEAGADGVGGDVNVVADERCWHGYAERFAVGVEGERQQAVGGDVAVANEAVPGEVVRGLRRAVAREVFRGGVEAFREGRQQAARDHAFFEGVAEANAEVVTRVKDVDDAVAEREFELDVRVARAKFGDKWPEYQLVSEARQGHAHEAGGDGVVIAHAFDDVLQGLHGVAAARKQAASGFGEFDVAGGAGKERQAEVLFQCFQRFADRRRGDL